MPGVSWWEDSPKKRLGWEEWIAQLFSLKYQNLSFYIILDILCLSLVVRCISCVYKYDP